MIKLSNVSNDYNGQPVIKNISLEINKGECVSFIAPSGAGKTTLLNIISGMQNEYSGEILINGVLPKNYTKPIAYMTQQDLLLPFYTLYKNLMLPLIITGQNEKQNKERIEEKLKQFGLYDSKSKYPDELSGGMRQRASLLRAFLIKDAEIMLLDEPFSSLDAITRFSMHTLLLKEIEESKKTVIFITHDVDEAILLSGRIYVFSKAPATILKNFDVPFIGNRGVDFALESQFISIKKEIMKTLKESFL